MRVLITGMGGEVGTRVTNLLEADPTNDIRNAARVFRVIRNGTVFDPATLGPR